MCLFAQRMRHLGGDGTTVQLSLSIADQRHVLQCFTMHLTSSGPNHSLIPLTLDLQHLLVTPGAVPLFFPPGIPQSDHEQLFCIEREYEAFSKAQLPNRSH